MPDMLDYGERHVRTFVERAKAMALQASLEEISTASATPLIQVEISASQAEAWAAELLEIASYDNGIGTFETQAALALDRVNMPELSKTLAYMRKCSDAAPALWIKGVNFGHIPPTSPERCALPTQLPEGVLAGLAKKLGTKLVGFEAEKIYSHPLFHDIRPVRGGKEGSVGDGQPLDHHMDMSYMREKAPNYVALACLREGTDHTVTTPFVDNAQLYKKLLESYPEDVSVLRDPRSFSIKRPASAGGGLAAPGAVLTDSRSGPVFWLRVDHNLMVPSNEKAAKALQHLRELLYKIEINKVHLCTGDVLLINNYKSLHRRSHFTPTFTGADRLLMRAYFKEGRVPSTRIF